MILGKLTEAVSVVFPYVCVIKPGDWNVPADS